MSSRTSTGGKGLMLTRPKSEHPRGPAPVSRAKTAGPACAKQPTPQTAPMRRPSTSSTHPAITPYLGAPGPNCLRGKAKGVSTSMYHLKTQVSSLTSALQTAVDTWGAFCEDLAAEAERNKLEVTRLTALVKSQQSGQERNSQNLSYETKTETPKLPLDRSWPQDMLSECSYSDSYEHSYSSSYSGSRQSGRSHSENSQKKNSGSSGRSCSSVYSEPSSDSELNQDPEDSS